MLVHPDKNPSMPERASLAFEGMISVNLQWKKNVSFCFSFIFLAINKAYKMLEDETERKKCLEVVEEARDRVEKMVSFCFFPTHKSVRSCP